MCGGVRVGFLLGLLTLKMMILLFIVAATLAGQGACRITGMNCHLGGFWGLELGSSYYIARSLLKELTPLLPTSLP